MPLREARELYVSSNGDRWEVGRDLDGKLVVVHRPNEASGGNITVRDVGLFLAERSNLGPEHQALMELLRSGWLDTGAAVEPDATDENAS